jgi:glyoxylase-like metal-dependent hydrolase (beta-lactamase superfamily II)
MDDLYQGAEDVHVLPTSLSLPGMGVLPVNAFLLMAEEPVLIDSGVGLDADDFIAAASSVIDLERLKWVWLTHDDADHTGSLQRIMEAAPNATLVTHALGALRMSTWWPVPMERVHAVRPGDEIHVGDRTLSAIPPPLFDNPTTLGVLDQSTGSLFSADAFGAIIPEPTTHASDIPREALAGGMVGWAVADSPWAHILDRDAFGGVLDRVRKLQPTRIFSSHLPVADGTALEDMLTLLEGVPDAERFMPPDAEQFAAMIDAMAAEQQQRIPEQASAPLSESATTV